MTTSGRTTNDSARILIVDDHRRARDSMADILAQAGFETSCCGSAVEALNRLCDEEYDVIITDLKMPGMSGLDLMKQLVERRVSAQVVMVTAHATVTTAVEAMRCGAFDYIEKPFSADQLEDLVQRALRRRTKNDQRCEVPGQATTSQVTMIGASPAMQALRQRLEQVAPTDVTVLISGESGTGKELVAHSIHAASDRGSRAMVSLNCAAMSPQLMESELFGHQQGAFTSADAPRVGRFELADAGTILLDEVTEVALPLQAKLLRVLQEQTFERVGSSHSQTVDVRVLATTNRDVAQEVQAGNFREDLYFRLAVVPIELPPLRARAEDIPALANHFLHLAAQRLDREPCELQPAAHQLLCEYHWPGNIRELQNIITRASVLSTGRAIRADEIRPWLIDADGSPIATGNEHSGQIQVGMSLREMERRLIEATMERFDNHRARTAEALGIGVRTLANKLRGYGYGPRERVFARSA